MAVGAVELGEGMVLGVAPALAMAGSVVVVLLVPVEGLEHLQNKAPHDGPARAGAACSGTAQGLSLVVPMPAGCQGPHHTGTVGAAGGPAVG